MQSHTKFCTESALSEVMQCEFCILRVTGRLLLAPGKRGQYSITFIFIAFSKERRIREFQYKLAMIMEQQNGSPHISALVATHILWLLYTKKKEPKLTIPKAERMRKTAFSVEEEVE